MFKWNVQMSDGFEMTVECSSNGLHAMEMAERQRKSHAFGSRALSANPVKDQS